MERDCEMRKKRTAEELVVFEELAEMEDADFIGF
jgi:hypothetical protein